MDLGSNLQQLGMEFGGGMIMGVLSGFAAKKLFKLIAIIIGIEVAVFKLLESRGILKVDWEKLTVGVIELGGTSGNPPSWLMTVLSTMSISAGFVGGFFLGFKRG